MVKKSYHQLFLREGGLHIVNYEKNPYKAMVLRLNPVSGPFYRFLKDRKNIFLGQDKVRKSQDFGFQNLRMNPEVNVYELCGTVHLFL